MKSSLFLAAAFPLAVVIIAAGSCAALFAQWLADMPGVADGVASAGAAGVFGFIGGTLGNTLSGKFGAEAVVVGCLSSLTAACLAGYLTGALGWPFWSATPLAIGVGVILGIQGKPAYVFLSQAGFRKIKERAGVDQEDKKREHSDS